MQLQNLSGRAYLCRSHSDGHLVSSSAIEECSDEIEFTLQDAGVRQWTSGNGWTGNLGRTLSGRHTGMSAAECGGVGHRSIAAGFGGAPSVDLRAHEPRDAGFRGAALRGRLSVGGGTFSAPPPPG